MEPEGVHPRVMSGLADELAKLLSVIYPQSWLTVEVPDDWKLASMTLSHKKGWKEDLGNYRSVSLTSAPGEILEQFTLSVIKGNAGSNMSFPVSLLREFSLTSNAKT
ncbi:hypothetical protein HGM15179_016985 [Zosterops borbonicus]|uniref:Uncharacterized protein n=1 Tax=Zosterops borbonicus TaxID=364589 RepID=A0A8K1G1T4_9PASS|nr:hypothetical protein HGM15179_016985 [Zosterops borbonicus]